MSILVYGIIIIIILFIWYYVHNLKKKVEEGDDYESKDTKRWMKALIPYYKIL
jgi:hypothetical protein